MARPGLEPGHHDFSSWAAGASYAPWGIGTSFGTLRASVARNRSLEVPPASDKMAYLRELLEMARPGLEPGTPRFSGSRRTGWLPDKDLQMGLFAPSDCGRCRHLRSVWCAFGTLRTPRSPDGPRSTRSHRIVDLRRVRRSGPRPDPRVTSLAGSRRQSSVTALHGGSSEQVAVVRDHLHALCAQAHTTERLSGPRPRVRMDWARARRSWQARLESSPGSPHAPSRAAPMGGIRHPPAQGPGGLHEHPRISAHRR
jgi:hypothetical protein